jgi:hypothetical protein
MSNEHNARAARSRIAQPAAPNRHAKQIERRAYAEGFKAGFETALQWATVEPDAPQLGVLDLPWEKS